MQQGLPDRTKALRNARHDEGSLAARANVSGNLAKTAGMTSTQAVARLLKAAPNFEELAAFDRPLTEAVARPRRPRKRPVSAEMNATVCKVAVDWAEWLARRGTTGKVTGAWKVAAERLGLTLENLANVLATVLERLGTLEACQATAKERDAFVREIGQRRAAIAKLTAEDENMTATHDAVTTHGSSQAASSRRAAVAAVKCVRAEFASQSRGSRHQNCASHRAMIACW